MPAVKKTSVIFLAQKIHVAHQSEAPSQSKSAEKLACSYNRDHSSLRQLQASCTVQNRAHHMKFISSILLGQENHLISLV
jgi:hypothetical protein